MDPASPQRDALLRAPTLDLTLPEALDKGRQEEDSEGGEEGEDLTLPEVLDGRRQEEDSEDESKEDVSVDVNASVEEPKDSSETKEEESSDVEEEEKLKDVDSSGEKEKSGDIEEEEKPLDWGEEVKKEATKKLAKEEEETETGEEGMEELRRRLTLKATGPPPVCRVRAFEARDEDKLSFQPGDIIAVHRLSKANPNWVVGALDGKNGYVPIPLAGKD